MERIIERRATKLLQWELAQTKPLLEALDDEGRNRHVTNRLRVIEETLRGRLDRVEASVDQTALDDIARFDNQQFMQMMTDMCTASALCELVVPLLEQMEGGAPRDTPAEVRQLLPKLRRQVRRTAELEQKVMPDETAGE
jgi:hypothetical protein